MSCHKVHPKEECPFQGAVPAPEPLGLPQAPGSPRRIPATGTVSPSMSLQRSQSASARHQYVEQAIQVLNDSQNTAILTAEHQQQDLVFESFRWVLPLRPGMAALCHAGLFLVLACCELFQIREPLAEELALISATFLLAAVLPLFLLTLGLWRRRIWHSPPLLLALIALLPCASGVCGRLLWNNRANNRADAVQLDLLKAAALQLATAAIFRQPLLARAVSALVSVVALVLMLLPELLEGRLELVEGLLLYVVFSFASLAIWSPHSKRCGLWRAVAQAASVREQDATCWTPQQLFRPLLGAPGLRGEQGLSQVILRQRLCRQLQELGFQASHAYFLGDDARAGLVDMVELVQSSIGRCLEMQDSRLDVSQCPPLLQDWLQQNFSRSVSEGSNLLDSGKVDMKKATRKFREKFQSGGSSNSKSNVGPSIPEHAQSLVGAEFHEEDMPHVPSDSEVHTEDDYAYPHIVSAMMSVLRYSGEGVAPLVPQETIQLLMAQFGNWDFNVVGFSEVVGSHSLRIMAAQALEPYAQRLGISGSAESDRGSLPSLLQSIESRYQRGNPYHNSVHAADVVNSVSYFLAHFKTLFSDLEIFAAILAAAAHDLGHDGKSSRYHTTTESPLALLYNDSSVLEMMHCSIFFAVLRSQGSNILNDLEHADRQAFRQQAIRMILDTDLAKHFDQVKKFRESHVDVEVYSPEERTVEQRTDVLSFMLKLSDIGGSAKPFALHAQWATRINAEFFLQGDLEREIGLPCSPFCDRQVRKVAESQQGFYKFIVKPLYDCLGLFLNSTRLELEVLQNIPTNQAFWMRYDGSTFNYDDPMASTQELVKCFARCNQHVSSDQDLFRGGALNLSQEEEVRAASKGKGRAVSQGIASTPV
eukprot:CAMPEP_0181410036 /NCGR_PEP_ID=MMETSP1110-20121109/7131_1 /TAXON_ID=174948 /ORGANISM="Symbiodinium sp., Strain CCMP421" /LENGTH=875 /DNA_ID=CAMNT_0023532569 /DNA_START=24 /DNA_END=2651 /DNA_ORIENTATION=-